MNMDFGIWILKYGNGTMDMDVELWLQKFAYGHMETDNTQNNLTRKLEEANTINQTNKPTLNKPFTKHWIICFLL